MRALVYGMAIGVLTGVLMGCPTGIPVSNNPDIVIPVPIPDPVIPPLDPDPVDPEPEPEPACMDREGVVFAVEQISEVVEAGQPVRMAVSINKEVCFVDSLDLTVQFPQGATVVGEIDIMHYTVVDSAYFNNRWLNVSLVFGDPMIEENIIEFDVIFASSGPAMVTIEDISCYDIQGAALEEVGLQDARVEVTGDPDPVDPEPDCNDRSEDIIFSIEEVTVNAGESVRLAVKINRPVCYLVALDLSLTFPQGVIIESYEYLGSGTGIAYYNGEALALSVVLSGQVVEGEILEFTVNFEDPADYIIQFAELIAYENPSWPIEIDHAYVQDGLIHVQ